MTLLRLRIYLKPNAQGPLNTAYNYTIFYENSKNWFGVQFYLMYNIQVL